MLFAPSLPGNVWDERIGRIRAENSTQNREKHNKRGLVTVVRICYNKDTDGPV